MIHLSTAAVNEIRRLLLKQLKPNTLFRLQVQAGGCSGLFYELRFDETIGKEDQVYECNGIPVVVDAQSVNYITGLTIDYTEDLMGGGFRFHNPVAIALCGCGNSFSTSANS